MKKRIQCFQFMSILCWAALKAGQGASAQVPPVLDIQLFAGLRIMGAVGTVYSVEYLTNVTQPNGWRSLSFLQLPTTNYLWLDSSAAATGQRLYRAVQLDAPTNMVFIPPGTFRLGSPPAEIDRFDSEGPQTVVTISRGFWMGKYEVTQGEYLAVTGKTPSSVKGDTNRPVELVSWLNATNYCGKLTQQERAVGHIATNSVYRLPTEAEWEYACRALTSTRFSYGEDPDYTHLTNYAWYKDNSDNTTHVVGQKLPNPWGLYDMHGNVWEWCQDWYGPYPGSIALDPQGPKTGLSRVVRGGNASGFNGDARLCRSAQRGFGLPGNPGNETIGFRVVLAPGQP